MALSKIYFTVKPFLPRGVRLAARRWWAKSRLKAYSHRWPIDDASAQPPPGWPGWPDGKRFAVVLTHDVEGSKGLAKVKQLMELDARHGFRSCFNFVPEGEYLVPEELRRELDRSGFEIGVHGLKHDGKLYASKAGFTARAKRINEYLGKWNACGFRSPLMQHNLAWLHQLHIEYDCSTFDTDPFEPEADGFATVFPFWVPQPGGTGYVELPYTLPQDSTLFLLLREQNIAVWRQKLDWVASHGGMVLLNAHPDYMSFDDVPSRNEYPASRYEELLEYVQDTYSGQFWSGLPRDLARYYCSALPAPMRNTRKRICMLSYSGYISDSRVRRYAESLARRGDRVDVIAIHAGNGNAPLTPQKFNGVNLYELQNRKTNERRKWQYLLRFARFFLSSSRFLTNHDPLNRYDLIHVHNMPDFLVFAAWRSKLSGAKLILDQHDLMPELFTSKFQAAPNGPSVKLLKLVEKASAAFADHVIISNHLWYETVTARSVPKSRCSAYVNYVDSAIFHPRPRTRADEKTIILFPGSFHWHQGLDIAIKALPRVREKIPAAELHLYGSGRLEPDLRQLAEALGLDGAVRFCGTVSLEGIADVMANADIGVVPKRADTFGNEAYSTKIMQFMSQGVPVIASRTKIDTYYFSDDVVRFFTSGDSQELADAIVELVQRPDLRETLTAKAHGYVALNNWDTRKQDYFNLVDSLTVEGL